MYISVDLQNFYFISDQIKFGVKRLVEKLDDDDQQNDKRINEIIYQNPNRLRELYHNNIITMSDKYIETSASDQKSSSPELRERSPISSPELEVDSPSTSPPLDVTCRTPSPFSKPPKNSESFSVNALLKPDIPRINRNNFHPAFAETISVTRSLLYPNLPFPEILIKEGKDMNTNSTTILPRHIHSFGIPHNVYSVQNTSTLSKDNVDFIDANRNFLAGSLYLSLEAVQAAAAAAIGNPPTINQGSK